MNTDDTDTPVNRRRNRLFVPLDVEFATDPKILDAGPVAAYLYIVGLAYCKRSDKAGTIHQSQLRVLALGLPGRPERHATKLVQVGLWNTTVDGWVIPAWLKHNLSPDQLEANKQAAKAKSIRGNHKRHHVDKGEWSPDCPLCEQDPSPRGTSKPPTKEELASLVEKREVETRQVEKSRVETRQAPGDASHTPHGEHVRTPAAAALKILIEHRMATDTGISNPDAYRTWLTNELRETHRRTIAAYVERRPNATAEEIACYVLNVPGLSAHQTEPKPDWYYDPACPDHDDSGLQQTEPEGPLTAGTWAPCHCRSRDPYPSNVIELRPAQ